MRIHHVALTSKNIEQSKEFYSRYFGFKEVLSFERPDLLGKAVFLECDNAKLEIWEFENSKIILDKHPINNIQEQGIQHVAFEIKNIEEFVKILPKEIFSTEIQKGRSGAKFCFIKDPTGINIELYEPA
jgi:catechol 2,3-dioxygenase-like lactoylglutathione lyase family enzyme